MVNFLKNILAGAKQQEDDTQEYRELPLHTIHAPNGDPYLSVIHDGETVRIRLHTYDDIYKRGIFMRIDRRAIPELIKALAQVEK